MEALFFIAWFAFWNVARGRRLFNSTDSTVIGRLVATLSMTFAVSALHPSLWLSAFTWSALMLWCTPAWDEQWHETITGTAKERLMGLRSLGLRMALAAPAVVGVAILAGNPFAAPYALFTPVLAVPYFVCGYLPLGRFMIPMAEGLTGALLGLLLYNSVLFMI